MLLGHIKNEAIRTASRIFTALMPVKKWRTPLRRYLLRRYSNASYPIYNSAYPIYPPHYDPDAPSEGTEPELYNRFGERVRTYFFRDYHLLRHPTMSSRYFQFERYNIGLDTHFYGHTSMLETMGKPKKRYGYLLESRGLLPFDYTLFERYAGLHKDFDLIFTHDKETLEKYDNARFWPAWAVCWIPDELCSPDLFERKTRKASIVSSYKTTCELHHNRIATARYLKGNSQRLGVDAFGTFDGGSLTPIHETLLDYRYSIAVENYISPLFFTERLINCFAACTVPIYVGAADVGDFFNTDGIIQISPDALRAGVIDKILEECTESDYAGRREAILDNFHRALAYKNAWDYLYVNYLRD